MEQKQIGSYLLVIVFIFGYHVEALPSDSLEQIKTQSNLVMNLFVLKEKSRAGLPLHD